MTDTMKKLTWMIPAFLPKVSRQQKGRLASPTVLNVGRRAVFGTVIVSRLCLAIVHARILDGRECVQDSVS